MSFPNPAHRCIVGAAPGQRGRLLAIALLAVCFNSHETLAAEKNDWAQSPYQVHVTLATDTALRPQPGLDDLLAMAIVDRVARTVAPLWAMELSVAQDAPTRRNCLAARELAWDELPAELKTFDKLMWLGVRVTPLGYELTCREFDAYTRRWGAEHRRTVSQAAYLAEACFQLLVSAFTPLATITSIPDDDAHVQLVFKGSELPRRAETEPFMKTGDLFQPLLRRTDRGGKLMDNGVSPVPWTYLATAAAKDGNWMADVHTGIRRPFGAQRGRVEQLAIALRYPPGPARVRFHARNDPKQGLAGYEVFRNVEDGSPQLIGITDHGGQISIPPDEDKSFTTVLLRSEGQLLAKAPIPSGSGPLIEMPVADNIARLQAQSEAQVVREQLVDVVARRAIMMARIRALLKKDRVEDARKLMAELDALPTSSTFSRNIDAAARKIPATDDPSVQRTIDKLFSSTRELLAKFLDRRQVIDLQSEVNAARAGGS